MKHCPICDAQYDEEIIRFCTIDGTPLIEDDKPGFTALPSENADEAADDFGEETVIRRNSPASGPFGTSEPERFVIPTTPADDPPVRARTIPAYYAPPDPPNTMKTVALTIIGTLVVLGFGAGLFWLFQKDAPANFNLNINANLLNQNTNLNTNLGFDSNFNFNTNANFASNYNYNFNLNTNTRTPSPTSTPTPRISPSPIISPSPNTSPTPSSSPRPVNTPRPGNSNGAPTGTPRTGPRPPTPRPTVPRPPDNGEN